MLAKGEVLQASACVISDASFCRPEQPRAASPRSPPRWFGAPSTT